MSAVRNTVEGVGGVSVQPFRGPASQIAGKQIACIPDYEGYINSNVALSAFSGHGLGLSRVGPRSVFRPAANTRRVYLLITQGMRSFVNAESDWGKTGGCLALIER